MLIRKYLNAILNPFQILTLFLEIKNNSQKLDIRNRIISFTNIYLLRKKGDRILYASPAFSLGKKLIVFFRARIQTHRIPFV
jgi:hypothetical protein